MERRQGQHQSRPSLFPVRSPRLSCCSSPPSIWFLSSIAAGRRNGAALLLASAHHMLSNGRNSSSIMRRAGPHEGTGKSLVLVCRERPRGKRQDATQEFSTCTAQGTAPVALQKALAALQMPRHRLRAAIVQRSRAGGHFSHLNKSPQLAHLRTSLCDAKSRLKSGLSSESGHSMCSGAVIWSVQQS